MFIFNLSTNECQNSKNESKYEENMTCKNNGVLNTETQFCTCIGNYTGKYYKIYSEFQQVPMNQNDIK